MSLGNADPRTSTGKREAGRVHHLLGAIQPLHAKALTDSQRAFTIKTYGTTASCLARPSPEQSRRLVQDRIRLRLSPRERAQVNPWLEAAGLAAVFLS